MELVKGNLFNEEIRRKTSDIENEQALIIASKRRNKNRGQKDHDKFKGRSQSKDKIKYFHCGKGHEKELQHLEKGTKQAKLGKRK